MIRSQANSSLWQFILNLVCTVLSETIGNMARIFMLWATCFAHFDHCNSTIQMAQYQSQGVNQPDSQGCVMWHFRSHRGQKLHGTYRASALHTTSCASINHGAIQICSSQRWSRPCGVKQQFTERRFRRSGFAMPLLNRNSLSWVVGSDATAMNMLHWTMIGSSVVRDTVWRLTRSRAISLARSGCPPAEIHFMSPKLASICIMRRLSSGGSYFHRRSHTRSMPRCFLVGHSCRQQVHHMQQYSDRSLSDCMPVCEPAATNSSSVQFVTCGAVGRVGRHRRV